jgi:hypothetical protein
MSDTTTAQFGDAARFGDACELLIYAELTLAGIPAYRNPQGLPSYDLLVETSNGWAKISVKGLRAGHGQSASYWRFKPDGWDWLALVRFNTENGTREFFILPRENALELSKPDERRGTRHINYSDPRLQAYRVIGTISLSRS